MSGPRLVGFEGDRSHQLCRSKIDRLATGECDYLIAIGENGSNSDVTTLWSTRDGGAQWRALVPQVNQ